jgi:hypothetical protein
MAQVIAVETAEPVREALQVEHRQAVFTQRGIEQGASFPFPGMPADERASQQLTNGVQRLGASQKAQCQQGMRDQRTL